MSDASARGYALDIVKGLEANPPEDMGDYLEGVLDLEFVRGSDGTLRRAGVMIAFGGPNAWLWTNGSTFWVDANWASETASIPAFHGEEFAAELFDYLDELGR